MRIRIFSNFCDSQTCAHAFINVNNLDDSLFTCDESYTHAIILNTATPALSIPKEHVIGLAFEPNQFLHLTKEFIQYAKKHIGKYYIGSSKGLPEPFTEGYGFLHHTNPKDGLSYHKRKPVSLMISQKLHAPGHRYRHMLAQRILQSDLPVDIYGRGCKYHNDDPRLKGEFNDDVMYTDYKYHICIENYKLPAYVSEKITNTLCCGATPIYWGSPLMEKYSVTLTGDIDRDMETIKSCIARDVKRQPWPKFIQEFNFMEFLEKAFTICI